MKTLVYCCVVAIVSFKIGTISNSAATVIPQSLSSESALIGVERQIREYKETTGDFPISCKFVFSPAEMAKDIILSESTPGKIDIFCVSPTNVILRTSEYMLSQPNMEFVVLRHFTIQPNPTRSTY